MTDLGAMNDPPLASPPIHVVLFRPEIHWNTGNVGRTCLGVGAQLHLVRPLGFQLSSSRLRRAGLDYWPRVAPRVWDDWKTLERQLPAMGSSRFFSPEAPKTYWEGDYSGEVVLVFGSESVGLSKEIRNRYSDQLYSIPMIDPELRSLNLSTTAALVLYEVERQRRASNRP